MGHNSNFFQNIPGCTNQSYEPKESIFSASQFDIYTQIKTLIISHLKLRLLCSCPNKCLENLPFLMCHFNIFAFTYYQEGHKIVYKNFPMVLVSSKIEYDVRKGKLLFLSSETARRAASNATSRLQVMTPSLQNSAKFK